MPACGGMRYMKRRAAQVLSYEQAEVINIEGKAGNRLGRDRATA